MRTIDNWIEFWEKRPMDDLKAEEIFVRGLLQLVQSDAFHHGNLAGLSDAHNIVRKFELHDGDCASEASTTCNLAANEIATKHASLDAK